jgi:NADH dehydrogenase FAD-containing subunit
MKNIMLIGGGHCNCQVLKMLKKDLVATGVKARMTLVNEAPRSYYSGMLPGAVASNTTYNETNTFDLFRALYRCRYLSAS